MTNNPARGLRWRVAAVAALAIVIVLWRSADRGPRHVIQIDFSMSPSTLAGAEVIIDGGLVGSLSPQGSREVTGFRVDEGDHTVQLLLETCWSEQRRVTTGFGGPTVRLVAWAIESDDEAARTCEIHWER